jgi:hypothetical protein
MSSLLVSHSETTWPRNGCTTMNAQPKIQIDASTFSLRILLDPYMSKMTFLLELDGEYGPPEPTHEPRDWLRVPKIKWGEFGERFHCAENTSSDANDVSIGIVFHRHF